MSARQPRPAWFLGLLAALALSLLAAFVSLGQWQVQRRAWKLALIERVNQRVHEPAVPAPRPAEWPTVTVDTHEYRRVRLQGRFAPERSTWVQATTELGSGYWLLTPLTLTEGGIVLVNRGFVPMIQRTPAATAPGAAPPQVELTGLLRLSEPDGRFPRRNDPAADRWYSRELPAIAAARQLGPVAPYFVDADRDPQAAPGDPVGGLTLIAFHNNHLVYALTWYGLAGLVLVAAALVARSERDARRTTPQPADAPAD